MAKSHVNTKGRSPRKLLLEALPVEEKHLHLSEMPTTLLEGGDGPPMVLLHGGIQAGGLVWWRALPRLTEGRRVIVPDLPGLGESEIGPRRLDAQLVSRWLEELIQETCPEPPTLVAHSATAAFAARFAVERSDRLRHLVLVDPGGLRRSGLPPPGVLLSALRSTSRPSDRNLRRFMGRVMHDLDRVRDEDDLWPTFSRYLLAKAVLPGVKRTMRQAAKVGLRGAIAEAELAGIAVPVALIWGRRDPLTPPAIGERLSSALGWPLHLMADAGHLPHVEQPEAFIGALRAAVGGW